MATCAAHAIHGRRVLTAFVAILAFTVQNFIAPLVWACSENAMLVFDASGSMALFRDGRPKIDLAREAAADVLPNVTRYRPTGLVTYSGGRGPACSDVNLRVEPALRTAPRILSALEKMRPNGATPLSDAVMLASNILLRRDQPGIVVLVTDGLENCGKDACSLARRLKAERHRLRVHVISFYLHGRAVHAVRCLAEATGGTYVSTASLDELRDALRALLSCLRLSGLSGLSHLSGLSQVSGLSKSEPAVVSRLQ